MIKEDKSFSPTLDLNPKQKLAVEHIEGPMLILAGAGSGKTRVVTCRIAHLLKLGVPASEILALTFTNKAAAEMRFRIKILSHQLVLTSTFHALGAKILRESIHLLGYQNDFTIYDEKDSLQLLKQCLLFLGCKKEDKGQLKSIRIEISNRKNALLKPNPLSASHDLSKDILIEQAYSLYQEKLKEYNAVDFDDLLFLTGHLLKDSTHILEKYQKQWSFVLVDEYQDTNCAQYLIIKLLTARHQNLFVVGDPDQSIYSWRGANLSNILEFEKDYENAQIITLEQNYRSTTNILEGANALIKHNAKRYEKRLWSNLGRGEKIGVYRAKNEIDEAQFVLEKLLALQEEENISLNECAIFYRTNAQSRSLEDLFLKYKIPYLIIGGISFYQRKEIKDILAFLRMATSQSDFLSFVRTIHLPKRGIGLVALNKWRQLSEELQLPILLLCQTLIEDKIPQYKLTKKQREGLLSYLKIIQTLKDLCKKKASLEIIIEKAIDQSHYKDILKTDPETAQERLENLEALINKAAEWSEENESFSLLHFLQELSLKSSLDQTEEKEAVRLMTLHNGKGLEFTLTFIVGMEEDLFPHLNAKHDREALEEERRLCYVGMTRAKEYLYLSSSSYRLMWGQPKVMIPSRFLKEIPSQYLLELVPQEEKIETTAYASPKHFSVGTVVFHKDFGKGEVRKTYETSLGLTYDVFFPKMNTTRSLVAKYAKLKLIDGAAQI